MFENKMIIMIPTVSEKDEESVFGGLLGFSMVYISPKIRELLLEHVETGYYYGDANDVFEEEHTKEDIEMFLEQIECYIREGFEKYDVVVVTGGTYELNLIAEEIPKRIIGYTIGFQYDTIPTDTIPLYECYVVLLPISDNTTDTRGLFLPLHQYIRERLVATDTESARHPIRKN